MTKRKKVEYKMLEPLDPKEVDRAFDEWRNEDDGTEDYPSLGEVLAVRFGAEQGQADNADLRVRLAAVEAELAGTAWALQSMVRRLEAKLPLSEADEFAVKTAKAVLDTGQRGAQLAALLAAVGELMAAYASGQVFNEPPSTFPPWAKFKAAYRAAYPDRGGA